MTMYRVYVDEGKKDNFELQRTFLSFEEMGIWESKFDFSANAYQSDVRCPWCKQIIKFNLKNDSMECPECGNHLYLWDVEDEL